MSFENSKLALNISKKSFKRRRKNDRWIINADLGSVKKFYEKSNPVAAVNGDTVVASHLIKLHGSCDAIRWTKMFLWRHQSDQKCVVKRPKRCKKNNQYDALLWIFLVIKYFWPFNNGINTLVHIKVRLG
jgi:hypothetical protein